MQFNTHADQQDCVSEINRICKSNTTSYPLKDVVRRFNHALDKYWAVAFKADGRWAIDDLTEAAPPIDTQNLVSGTNRYKIGTFTEKVINVIRFEVLDSSGYGVELQVENFNELKGPANTFQELYISPDSGTPAYYCKYGDFVYLRPSPNYSYTAGLVAYFNRTATHLASTATTTVPGVPENHIMYLCRLASLPYLIENGKQQVNQLMKLIGSCNPRDPYYGGDELDIFNYYAHRDKDARNVMRSRINSFR